MFVVHELVPGRKRRRWLEFGLSSGVARALPARDWSESGSLPWLRPRIPLQEGGGDCEAKSLTRDRSMGDETTVFATRGARREFPPRGEFEMTLATPSGGLKMPGNREFH